MKKTVLHDWHQEQGAKMFEFAGWEMPVHYGDGILKEHRQVRSHAGLFDIGHMGVLECTGKDARHFLDLTLTNYASWLEDNEAQYSFILSPEGTVLDDLLLYRRSETNFFLVVNAANKDDVESWLRSVRQGEGEIDPHRPHVRWSGNVEIRDMKAQTGSKAQQEGRLDLALQGPHSFQVLQQAINDTSILRRIDHLKRFEFLQAPIQNWDVIISKTGYTGETEGFELYVDPSEADAFWTFLLDQGSSEGLIPVGLGARDTLRIEAGLPLHGKELAGPHNISPFGAGYGSFVKWHKPFFIGRESLKEREVNRSRKVIRFKTGSSGRPVREKDLVLDRHGEMIGEVTSTLVKRDQQIGLAHVHQDHGDRGNELFFLSNRVINKRNLSIEELNQEDVEHYGRKGEVLSRFISSDGESVSWGEDE